MLIAPTLLTPLILATTPVIISVQSVPYSHFSQGVEIAQLNTGESSVTTYNGTQTFDAQGRPRDADNDSQRD
jgi:hypothetical protein